MPSPLPLSFLLFLSLVGGRTQKPVQVEIEGKCACASEGKELGLEAWVLG